jgi:hypothetical protein
MVHLLLSMLRPNLLKISESAFCVELRDAEWDPRPQDHPDEER